MCTRFAVSLFACLALLVSAAPNALAQSSGSSDKAESKSDEKKTDEKDEGEKKEEDKQAEREKSSGESADEETAREVVLEKKGGGNSKQKGNLEHKDVFKVMDAHAKLISWCYETRLLSKPELEGKIVVKLVINPEGKVEQVSAAENTAADKTLETCVLDVVRTLEFPNRGDEPIHMTYPFVFRRAK
ncbi:AgmX/PglI C-terminal domain-containing protein [Persicimonas caeni]|nr:AgmX/PglI C-terminal domain-containing protein [Persicimonas caeni]